MITLLIGPNWTCPDPLLPLLTLTPHLVKISQNIYSSYWPLNVGLTSQFPPTHQRSISLLGSPWTGHVTWGGASNLGASIMDLWVNSNCRSWLASTNSHSENWFSFSTNFNGLRKNKTQSSKSSWTKTDYTRGASYPNLIWPLLPLSFSRTRRLPRAWTAGKGWRLTPLKAIPRNTNTLLSHGLYQWPKQARLGRSSWDQSAIRLDNNLTFHSHLFEVLFCQILLGAWTVKIDEN